MAFSPYVHRYSNNARLLYPYNSKGPKIEYTANNLINILQQPDLKSVETEMRKISGKNNLTEARKFFKEMGKELDAVLKKNNSNIPMIKHITGIKPKKVSSTKIIDSINNLNEMLTTLDNYLKSLEKYLPTKEFKLILNNIAIDQNINFLENYQFIKDYRTKVLNSNAAIKTRSLDGKALSQFKLLMGQKQSLEKLIKELKNKQNSGVNNISENELDIINHAQRSAVRFTNFLSGDIEEYIVEDIYNTQRKEKLKKIFKQFFNGSNGITVSAENIGTKTVEDTLGSISKGDVALTIKDDSAQISVKIPMSIKTTGQTIDKGELSIHTGTSVDNFLIETVKSKDLTFARHGIANILLWGDQQNKYLRKSGKDSSFSLGDRNNVLKALREAAVVQALAGSLTAGDFSWYFVVNRKVYSMYELLHKIINNKQQNFLLSTISVQAKDPKGKKMNLTKFQDSNKKKWDGDAVAKAMLASHFNIKLKMNLLKGY